MSHSEFEQLDPEAVLVVKASARILLNQNTFLVSEMHESLRMQIGISDPGAEQDWIDRGAKCRVLSPSKGWREGRVKLCLLFCADESKAAESPEDNKAESPLDEIRQMLNEPE